MLISLERNQQLFIIMEQKIANFRIFPFLRISIPWDFDLFFSNNRDWKRLFKNHFPFWEIFLLFINHKKVQIFSFGNLLSSKRPFQYFLCVSILPTAPFNSWYHLHTFYLIGNEFFILHFFLFPLTPESWKCWVLSRPHLSPKIYS